MSFSWALQSRNCLSLFCLTFLLTADWISDTLCISGSRCTVLTCLTIYQANYFVSICYKVGGLILQDWEEEKDEKKAEGEQKEVSSNISHLKCKVKCIVELPEAAALTVQGSQLYILSIYTSFYDCIVKELKTHSTDDTSSVLNTLPIAPLSVLNIIFKSLRYTSLLAQHWRLITKGAFILY